MRAFILVNSDGCGYSELFGAECFWLGGVIQTDETFPQLEDGSPDRFRKSDSSARLAAVNIRFWNNDGTTLRFLTTVQTPLYLAFFGFLQLHKSPGTMLLVRSDQRA